MTSKNYQERYRRNHPEYQIEYCRQHKEEIKAYQRAYYQNHRDELRAKHRDYMKTYYQAHPEWKVKMQEYTKNHRVESRTAVRKYSRQMKIQIFTHYCKGEPLCVACGITDLDVLCIDHINGGGNKQRRQLNIGSGKMFYSWLIRNNYPEGYQVLCANCNLKKQHLINN